MRKGVVQHNTDREAQMLVLGYHLEKATTFLRHVDSQANILLGISSGLFIFALSLSGTDFTVRLPLYVLAVFSGAAAVSALLAVHPPRRLRKQGQKESLLYHRSVSKVGSADKFATKLNQLLGQQKQITKQFATEIYNIYRYTYEPKRRFFNVGRNLLLAGIVSSFGLFVVLSLSSLIQG